MPQPKRWYQLSMLQLLVAMAVVAVFVVKNYSLQRIDGVQRYPSSWAADMHLRGWPFAYWQVSGFFRTGQNIVVGFPKYDWTSLAANIACCAGAIVVAIGMVALIRSMTSHWKLNEPINHDRT